MPDFIDPRWEYWTPDPEVEWAVYGGRHRVGGFDALGVEDFDAGRPAGLRFGTGNPDGWWGFRYGKEKVGRPTLPNRLCPGCGRLFTPDRRAQRYCGRECYDRRRAKNGPERAARTAWEPVPRPCRACKTPFLPRNPGSSVCGKPCAVRLANAAAARANRARIDPERLARLYAAGVPSGHLARLFGIWPAAILRALRRAGAAIRSRGGPGRRFRRWRTGASVLHGRRVGVILSRHQWGAEVAVGDQLLRLHWSELCPVSHQRVAQLRHRAAGLCEKCRRPPVDGRLCEYHRDRKRERDRESDRRRRAKKKETQ